LTIDLELDTDRGFVIGWRCYILPPDSHGESLVLVVFYRFGARHEHPSPDAFPEREAITRKGHFAAFSNCCHQVRPSLSTATDIDGEADAPAGREATRGSRHSTAS
jgi:hypothetical protein